jgi:hypothetical protein
MIKNIRHIQIKKVAYCPNLFKAILTFEKHPTTYDESDDLEYIKKVSDCPKCQDMEIKRRKYDKWERE